MRPFAAWGSVGLLLIAASAAQAQSVTEVGDMSALPARDNLSFNEQLAQVLGLTRNIDASEQQLREGIQAQREQAEARGDAHMVAHWDSLLQLLDASVDPALATPPPPDFE